MDEETFDYRRVRVYASKRVTFVARVFCSLFDRPVRQNDTLQNDGSLLIAANSPWNEFLTLTSGICGK